MAGERCGCDDVLHKTFIFVAIFAIQTCTHIGKVGSVEAGNVNDLSNEIMGVKSLAALLSDGETPLHEPVKYRHDRSKWVREYESAESDELFHDIPAEGIVSSCSAFINEFSDASANFTKCIIQHARPLRLCRACVVEYITATSLYHNLMEGFITDDDGRICGNKILNSNYIQVIQKTALFMEKLWTDCSCDSCFEYARDDNGTVHYKVSNETVEFTRLANQTLRCFRNYSHEMVGWEMVGVPIENSTVCTACHEEYDDVNEYYEHMKEEQPEICMDLADMMNATRIMWSRTFHCHRKPGTIWPVLVLSGFFCMLPIIFYCCNKIHGAKAQETIMRQRRLRDVTSPGRLGSSGSMS